MAQDKDDLRAKQLAKCTSYGSQFVRTDYSQKLGLADNAIVGVVPLNGLRHRPTRGTSGWYVWAGEELSDAPDFFKPIHVAHVCNCCPDVEPFLGLAPGWRFLIAGDYEDVWFDPELLEVK